MGKHALSLSVRSLGSLRLLKAIAVVYEFTGWPHASKLPDDAQDFQHNID
jgi:hypothetical protein